MILKSHYDYLVSVLRTTYETSYERAALESMRFGVVDRHMGPLFGRVHE